MRWSDGVFRLFLLLAAVQLAAEAVVWREAMAVIKPLLVPTLAWAWSRSVPGAPAWARRGVYGFYAASWVGDVALLLAPERPDDVEILGIPKDGAWFLVGVGAFAVAHLTLIGVLARTERAGTAWPGPGWAYAVAPMWVLGAGAVVVPAVLADPERAVAAGPLGLYGLVLVALATAALRRRGRVPDDSARAGVIGAAVFLLSDTSIGVVHLVHHGQVPLGGLFIMSTYLVAEVLLGHAVALQVDGRRRQGRSDVRADG